MASYTCFTCDKKVSKELMGRRVRCPYCGSKILYKSRTVATVVKAV